HQLLNPFPTRRSSDLTTPRGRLNRRAGTRPRTWLEHTAQPTSADRLKVDRTRRLASASPGPSTRTSLQFAGHRVDDLGDLGGVLDRKSTRLNSSHVKI